jgi:cell division protein FtsI (penicillin-binding protein 3)
MKGATKIYKWTVFMYCCFVLFAIYCIGFALSVIFDSDLRDAEIKERKKIVNSEYFRRGNILSFDGKPIAAYDPKYILFTDFGVRIDTSYTVDRSKVTTDGKAKKPVKLDTFRINIYKEFAKSLSKTVGGSVDDYYKELYNNRVKAEKAMRSGIKTDQGTYTENILTNPLDIFQRDRILGNPHLKKRGRYVTGIYDKEKATRMYPCGKNFAHSVIGVFKDETVSGIERTYNEELKNGDDVLTTIDARMQNICEAMLRNGIAEDKRLVGGTIILMEVATGNIKAIANLGAYYEEKYTDDYDIYNNATKAAIEPGSTFKIVSLMLALETGKVKLSDKFNTVFWRKRKYPLDNNIDTVATVSRIIELSNNVGAVNIVDKAFNRDINKFIQAIKSLKITDRIEKIDETQPYINRDNSEESMLMISHGYQVKMAPIHILSFYNAIANNGIMVKPRLVHGLIRRTTGKTELFEPEIINKSICSKSTLDSVRLALSRVVGRGSAWRIAGSPYRIAGKTGTADIWLERLKTYETAEGKRELASFCGYFPQKDPKYSCIVVLYSKFMKSPEIDKFSASSTAVPLFRKVSDKIYALYLDRYFIPSGAPANIPMIKNTRSKNLPILSEQLDLPVPVGKNNNIWVKVDTANNKLQISELSLKKGIVPDVTGMGLRDAVFLLENRGLKVSYSGVGTIIKQSLEHDIPYNPGQKIHLTLGHKR